MWIKFLPRGSFACGSWKVSDREGMAGKGRDRDFQIIRKSYGFDTISDIWVNCLKCAGREKGAEKPCLSWVLENKKVPSLVALAFLSSPAGGGGVDDMASGGRADATGRWISLWWVCRRSPQLARVQAFPCVSPPGQGPDLFLSPLSFAVLDWKSVQIISETFTQCFWGSIVIFLASISLYTHSPTCPWDSCLPYFSFGEVTLYSETLLTFFIGV